MLIDVEGKSARALRAVCHLRLQQPREALETLAPLLFPQRGASPDETVSDNWIVKYATALLLLNDVSGCQRALEWVKDRRHKGALRLAAAIAERNKSLRFRERWLRRGASLRPVVLDFPPGEF